MSRIVKLPAGYRQVDYIESTGTQYIDTGYKPNSETKVIAEVQMFSTKNNQETIFGARTSSSSKAYGNNILTASYRLFYNNGYSDMAIEFDVSKLHTVVQDKNVMTIGAYSISRTYAAFQCDYNMYLFAMNQTDAARFFARAKLYGCQIYDDGVLIRDYIPCKTTANVAGLYDLVGGKFYGNAGTGAFLYGAPKKLPQGYRRLTHIESSGTQYIDTGVIAQSGLEVYIDFEFTSVSTSGHSIFGAFGNSARIYPIYASGGVFGHGYGAWKASNTSVVANTAYSAYSKMHAGEQLVVVNGATIASGTVSNTYNSGLNLYMFALNYNGSLGDYASLKCKGSKILMNGTLVRDFVPCITDGGEVGLFDDLNGVFYGNAGSGTFISGQKIYTEEDITKVEYIESTGTQYINTGFKANQNTRVRVEAEATTLPTDNSGLFGGRTSATSKAFNFWWRVKNHGARFDYGAYDVDSENILPANTKITVDANKGNCSYGNYSETNTSSAFQCDYSLALFAINTGGTVGNFFVGKIYSCQIYDNGVFYLDYVPCTINGVAGLWDAISGFFYENAGTGTFISGSVIYEGLPAPQNLVALFSNGVVDLQWDAVENALGYKIARNFFPISVTNATHYADAEAARWGRHEYSVKAYTEEEESSAATIIVFVPGDNPILDLITDRTLADADRIVELSKKDYFVEMSEEERREYRGNPKGAYNAPDLNRVENAVAVLAERLGVLPAELKSYAASLGVAWDRVFDTPYDPTEMQLTTKTDWIFADVPDTEDMTRYLNNVRTLRGALEYSTSVLPTVMEELNWKSANAIEEALVKLDAAAVKFVADDKNKMERTAETWCFSGELYSGEV